MSYLNMQAVLTSLGPSYKASRVCERGGGRFETAARKELREAFRVKFMKDFLAVFFIFPLKTPSYKVKTWLKYKTSPLKLTMFFWWQNWFISKQKCLTNNISLWGRCIVSISYEAPYIFSHPFLISFQCIFYILDTRLHKVQESWHIIFSVPEVLLCLLNTFPS